MKTPEQCIITTREKIEIKRCDALKEFSQQEAGNNPPVSQPLLEEFSKNQSDQRSNGFAYENMNQKRKNNAKDEEMAINISTESNFVFTQWLTGFAVALLVMQPGLMGGWSSPTLATLMSPESPIFINPEQASWVVALVNFGRLFGSIVGPLLASFIGSKSTITATLCPLSIGWLLIFLATSVEWLYGARASLGFGLGMALSVFPLYIGEVSMPKVRGALISLASMGTPVGQLVASICGSYLSIPTAAFIYLVLALLLMLVFFWLPNSPHHLIKNGNSKDARKAIHWYRAGRDVDQELEDVERFVTGSRGKSFIDKLKEFKKPVVRKATFQIIALFAFMQISGFNSVMYYMEPILKNAKCTIVSPSLVVIGVNVCGIVSAVFSTVLIDRCGRKFLLIVSSAGVTVSMLTLSGYFLLMSMDKDTSEFEWVLIGAMFLFIVSLFVGLFPVPSAILSEIFPANIKSVAAIIASLAGAAVAFLSAKTYQPMVDYMGETYVFLFYAICASLCIPYTLLAVPETKGKTLQEVQDKLNRK